MSDVDALEGGCHCGALRYRVQALPAETAWMPSRIPCFDITDDLPRFDEEPPEPALD